MDKDTPDNEPSQPGRTPADSHVPTYTSEELLKGHREIWIQHGDEMYRLRLTSGGKLYLTK